VCPSGFYVAEPEEYRLACKYFSRRLLSWGMYCDVWAVEPLLSIPVYECINSLENSGSSVPCHPSIRMWEKYFGILMTLNIYVFKEIILNFKNLKISNYIKKFQTIFVMLQL
jgi:hypothetical protein